MRRLYRTLTVVAGISALVLAGACSDDGGSDDDSDGGTGEPDQVTYVTGFGLFGRDGHVFCAEEQGFFADQNIELQIEPGSGTEGNFSLLFGGQAHFSTNDLVGNLIALGQGTDGWKSFAALQQTNLSTWMTLDPELTSPADLQGGSIGVPPGAVTALLFPTYAELAGANPDEIEIIPIQGPDLPSALISGQVDAIGQFAPGMPGIRAAAEGEEVYVHPYTDVLTDLYGQSLVTTDEIIEEDPDLVTRFRDAFLAGYEWSLDNPEECGEIIAAHEDTVQPAEVAGQEIALLDPYSRVGDAPIGSIDEQRVARMIATLEAAGAIPGGITPEDVIAFDLAPQA